MDIFTLKKVQSLTEELLNENADYHPDDVTYDNAICVELHKIRDYCINNIRAIENADEAYRKQVLEQDKNTHWPTVDAQIEQDRIESHFGKDEDYEI